MYIERRYINYIVDADIKGFFDHVDHEWMMEFLKHRVNDPNLLRIIARFLKGGYNGGRNDILIQNKGPPRGSHLTDLANIYLHYVLDLWFEKRSENM